MDFYTSSRQQSKEKKEELEREIKKERLVAGILADGTDNETLHLFSIHYITELVYEKDSNDKHVIAYETRLGKRFVYPIAANNLDESVDTQLSLCAILSLNKLISVEEWLDMFPKYNKIKVTRWSIRD